MASLMSGIDLNVELVIHGKVASNHIVKYKYSPAWRVQKGKSNKMQRSCCMGVILKDRRESNGGLQANRTLS